MSSVPGTEALYNPTEHARVVGMPLDGIGSISNGVSTDFGSMLMDGVSHGYDNAKDSGTGFPATNRPYTYTFLTNTDRFGPEKYYHEALCFVHRVATLSVDMNQSINAQQTYLLSVSEFNRWLKSPEGRKLYGGDYDCRKLRRDWRFIGSVKRPNVNRSESEGMMMTRTNDAVPVIFAGRARMPDLGRAYVPEPGSSDRPAHLVPGQRDHLFFLYRRYNINDEEQQELIKAGLDPVAETKASSTGVPNTFWEVSIYTNRNGMAPDVALFTNETCAKREDRFVGDFDHIGFINFVEGDRSFDKEKTDAARAVIQGRDGYKNEVNRMTHVECFLAMN
jgi:hypothetical protein